MVYCRNNQCPFKDCDKHISKAKNLYEVYVANFDGVCRRYISWLLDEVDREHDMNGHGTDITRMVTTFVPDAIQNLQAYESMFNTKERPYDHVWDMYIDEFEDE